MIQCTDRYGFHAEGIYEYGGVFQTLYILAPCSEIYLKSQLAK